MLSRFLRGTARTNRRFSTRSLASSKYNSIDDFNKSKKDFKFGRGVDDLDSGKAPSSRAFNDLADSEILQDPRLQGLKPNSPDYKHQLFLIQQEYQANEEKKRERWEFQERLKGLGAGVLSLGGVFAAYQLFINYKYIKSYFNDKMNFDINVSHVEDMKDPKRNKKSMANMMDRLSSEVDEEFMSSLQDSTSVPGIYLFGAVAGKSLPTRVKEFDGKFFQDVLLSNNYIVAIDDKGRVFHYSKELKAPIEVSMPSRVSKVVQSNESLYYVSKDGRQIFQGKKIANASELRKGWFYSSVFYPVNKVKIEGLQRGETVDRLCAGASHLLILSSQGRLFEVNTTETPVNKGQYGLPKHSIYSQSPIPVNTAFELTNLNYEIVAAKDKKIVKPRPFSAIASCEFSNVAVDGNNNVWTWGDNSSRQCGKEASLSNDVVAVPKIVFNLQDLSRFAKYSLPDHGKHGAFRVEDVFAAKNTVYLKLAYTDESMPSEKQDILLSFGDGLQGQLGLSRYVHMAATPQVLKSFVGLREYDESTNSTMNIGIKDVSAGGDHIFVTLNNTGTEKEVLAFGKNDKGQFGNGKTFKSAKPIQLPKLLEPTDFEKGTTRLLVKKVNDQTRNRLQLIENGPRASEQVIKAGEDSSVIYYRRP